MKINTTTNIKNRINYLEKILHEDIPCPNQATLKDARSFCEYEMEGLFTKIAYNTVKAYLKTSALHLFKNHPYRDNWEYFLALRANCSALQATKIDGKNRSIITDHIDYKRAHATAVWHATLCSNAYLELRRDLLALANAGGNNLEILKLNKILDRSNAAYRQVVDLSPPSDQPKLHIIKGNPSA
jgi:hypothetical protein